MGMKVVVFDVEHGASAFIRTPTNYGVLIDCGCTGKFSPALYLVEKELPSIVPWDGHSLTKLIVTHPHDDHIGDVETVKEKCPPALLLRQKYDWEDVKTAECDYDNLDTYSEWQNTYNVGTQFASLAPANPPQVRETRSAVKWTYSFAP